MGTCATEMSTVSAISASCDPVDVLLELLATSSTRIPARAVRQRFGEALAYLEQIGAVQQDAILTEVTCHECHLHHSAALEFDGLGHAYQFFCPEAGFIAVTDADVAALCVKPDWILDCLARSLSFNPQIRRRTLVEGQGWLLGETVLDGTSVTAALVLGRLAANQQDALIQGISRFQPSGIGIVLTSSAELPSSLLALYGYHALDLREVISANDGGFALDYARLTTRALQFLRGKKATKGGGGRSSQAEKIRNFFAERRKEDVPYAPNLMKRQESEVPGRRVFLVKGSRDTRQYGICCRIPDHDPRNNRLRNLKSLCQHCHIIHDRPPHLVQRRITLLQGGGNVLFAIKSVISEPMGL